MTAPAFAGWRAGRPVTPRPTGWLANPRRTSLRKQRCRDPSSGHPRCGDSQLGDPLSWVGRPRHRQPAGDAGSATAELAVSLPALVLLLMVGLTALAAVRTQIECIDAAREAARAAARGEPVVSRVDGATITVGTDGDVARATVRVHSSPLGGRLPGFDISATAVAAVEPTS